MESSSKELRSDSHLSARSAARRGGYGQGPFASLMKIFVGLFAVNIPTGSNHNTDTSTTNHTSNSTGVHNSNDTNDTKEEQVFELARTTDG